MRAALAPWAIANVHRGKGPPIPIESFMPRSEGGQRRPQTAEEMRGVMDALVAYLGASNVSKQEPRRPAD